MIVKYLRVVMYKKYTVPLVSGLGFLENYGRYPTK